MKCCRHEPQPGTRHCLQSELHGTAIVHYDCAVATAQKHRSGQAPAPLPTNYPRTNPRPAAQQVSWRPSVLRLLDVALLGHVHAVQELPDVLVAHVALVVDQRGALRDQLDVVAADDQLVLHRRAALDLHACAAHPVLFNPLTRSCILWHALAPDHAQVPSSTPLNPTILFAYTQA